jgi:hypothetical protein
MFTSQIIEYFKNIRRFKQDKQLGDHGLYITNTAVWDKDD